MQTVADLKSAADEHFRSGAFPQALELYAGLVRAQSLNLDARLRVADCLLALGEVQRAAVVYTSLARHAAHAGYPLRALVALKILATLEPKLGVLLRGVAELYAASSKRLGRGARRAPPEPTDKLPPGLALGPPAGSDPIESATLTAAQFSAQDAVYPDKLMPIPVLSLLGLEEFEAVLGALKLVRARAGEFIVKEGEAGYSFFVIARGSVQVVKEQADGSLRPLANLHEGAIFGEMALLSALPRSASIRALSDCDLLEFDRDALLAASTTVNSLAGALAEFAQERLLSNLMASAELFKPLDRRQRLDLMRRFVAVDTEPGGVLIHEGEPGRGLHVILRGEVVVEKVRGPHRTELARLGPGELFGEISLLSEELTTATVRVSERCTTLFLSRDYFERLIEAVPDIRNHLEQLGENRMMDMHISMVPSQSSLGLISDLELDDDLEDEIEVEILP
jgi:CRP-like cAMP-binding protein